MAITTINGKRKYVAQPSMKRFFYIVRNNKFYSKKNAGFYEHVYLGEFFETEQEAKRTLEKIIKGFEKEITDYNKILDELNTKPNTQEYKERRIKAKNNIKLLESELLKFKECIVTEVPKESIENEYKLIMQHSVICGATFVQFLRHFKNNVETLSKVKVEEVKAINNLLKVLTPINHEFQRFLQVEEDLTYDYLDDSMMFINSMSKISIYEMPFFNKMFKMLEDKEELTKLKRQITRYENRIR